MKSASFSLASSRSSSVLVPLYITWSAEWASDLRCRPFSKAVSTTADESNGTTAQRGSRYMRMRASSFSGGMC